MQADRRRVGRITDNRDHLAHAGRRASIDDLAQQQRADAAAPEPLGEIDRILHRVAIGRAIAVGRGIGEAGDGTVDLGDQARQPAVADRIEPPMHLGRVGRRLVERGQAVTDVMGIDFGRGRDVAVPGRAHAGSARGLGQHFHSAARSRPPSPVKAAITSTICRASRPMPSVRSMVTSSM